MRAFPAAAAAVLALATPSLAHAQEVPEEAPEAALADMSDKLADPQFQDQAATIAQILLTSMLDLEIGPLAEAINRASDGRGPDIAPDARVRDIAPEAEDMPAEIAERLPEAMNSISALADGMQHMMPALQEMSDRMRSALQEASESGSSR